MSNRTLTGRVPALTLCVALVACGGGDDDGGGNNNAGSTRPAGALEWEECGDVECATLVVPRDHDDPAGPTVELALARRRADGERVGVLLVNLGGPGAPGVPVAGDAELYLSSDLVDRFDIIGWDPRGVGESTPVDCVDDLDAFFAVDRSPDDAAEEQENIDAAVALTAGCARRSSDLLPFVSTRATVADMDAIRDALREEQISYLGFSYGTSLGALYADTYPDRVRAIVLDGAVDPTLTSEELTRQQALGFEAALNAFLDSCERDGCGFGGSDPHAAYEQLMLQIDGESLPAELGEEERLLGPGEADIGVATALYAGRDGWDILAAALNDAATGDGTALLQLSDIYTGRRPGGEYDNSQEAFYAIGCVDAPAIPADQLPALAESLTGNAPNFGATTSWLSAPCSVWPVPAVGGPGPIVAPDAPPIVVVGTSNDPATPLSWAQAVADQMASATLLVRQGEGHTAYGSGNACIDDAVDAYLIELQVPAAGTVC